MSSPRITLRDIAQKAGVTIATVSLALRNSSEVSEERQQEIQSLAKAMGYIPDPGLSALAEYRREKRKPIYRQNLAFLYQAVNRESFQTWNKWPIRKQLIAGLQQRCQELGYLLEFHEIGTTVAAQGTVARRLRARGIQGVFLHATLQPVEPVVPQFRNFILLNLLQYSGNPSFHSIRSNEYEAMRLALLRLYEQGHRNFLYIRPNPIFGLFGPEKLGAFEWFMAEYPGTTCRWVDTPRFEREGRLTLAQPPRIDAVLFHDHLEFESMVRKQKIRFRRGCARCLLFASPDVPEYSGIDIQPHSIGFKAVELLDMMLRHNETKVTAPTNLLLQPVWLEQ